ncbi:MAG TPA: hypothetical protein VG603_04815 [Chitinophagales bacterium]|nr:hypothetical protein [Chitinophagales bacterium]
MKYFLTIILSVLLTFNSFAFKNTPSKYLVNYTLVKSHSKKTLSALWRKHHIPKLALPVRYPVDIYEVIYKAPWIDSSTWINCSGIVYVPKMKEGQKMATLMFGHGTQIEKKRDISDNDAQQGICLGTAADGYLSLYPDYYGLGKGDGPHLYQHAWSEGMAFLYMLYAVEELKQDLHIETNGQLFLTGYSQGGHASFAAQKYIEAQHDPRFKVTATSPMSGAYDMTGEQAKYMFQPYPRPFYLPYLIVSYQEAYHIFDTKNIYSVFRAPFDTLLPGFFGDVRSKTYDDLDKIMPKVPSDVILPEYVKKFKDDPNFAFLERLKENNLTNWKPEAPVQLCFCEGDREVNYHNSISVYDHMTANGIKDIKLDNISNYLDHNTCAAFAVLDMKAYFDRFRKHGSNPKMKALSPFKHFLVNIAKKGIERQYKKDHSDHAYM